MVTTLFNQDIFKILTNINTYYTDPANFETYYNSSYCLADVGAEMAGEGAQNPNKFGRVRGNNMSRYFISLLFDILYSDGVHPKTYTWRTGWTNSTSANSNFIAGNCALIFGLIPLTWNAGDNIKGHATERYGGQSDIALSRVGWRAVDTHDPYYTTASRLMYSDFFVGIEDKPDKSCIVIDKFQINEFNSLNDQDDPNYQWNSSTEQKNYSIAAFNFARPSIGLGTNPNIPGNNYKQISFFNTSLKFIVGYYSEDFTCEKYEKNAILKEAISNKCGTRLREGLIITKKGTGLDYVPTWGYYKQCYNNQYAGIADNDNIKIASRPSSYPNIMAINQIGWHALSNNTNTPMYSAEAFFGSPIVRNDDSDLTPFTLNYIFTRLTSSTMSAMSYTHRNEDVFPIIVKNNVLSTFPLYNMFEYSTIKIETNATYFGRNRYLDVIPVFATSLQKVSSSGNTYHGGCCIIHLFQSLIYNTHYNSPILTGDNGDGYKYGAEDDEVPTSSVTISETALENYSQTFNTHSGYNKFTMKMLGNNKIFLSYALTVNGNSSSITSITPGSAIAGSTDWIAWINGNIYVIPDSVFNTFVFYTKADFIKLDSAVPLMGYNSRTSE